MSAPAGAAGRQYETGEAQQRIRRALADAGRDPDRLDPQDLALMEDFHSSGRIATAALVELAQPAAGERALDAGTGIGGTARLLAHDRGCRVSAVDINEEYCVIAAWLNRACGLDAQIEVRRADVLELPFEDATFDLVFSQHVQMNVADKDGLYREARRVLKPGGRLAIWDVVAGPAGEIRLPVPWAEDAHASHLVTAEELAAVLERSGFEMLAWNDLTEPSAQLMGNLLAMPPAPLGLHVFVPEFRRKAENLVANLEQDRARLLQALLR